jgi:hypothetical protein
LDPATGIPAYGWDNAFMLRAVNAAGSASVDLFALDSSDRLTFSSDLYRKAASNFGINTISDDKQVRINSRAFTQASGDSIGFQSKPNQTVTTTGTVKGGDISPRLQDAIAAANLIGLHVDCDQKGTTGNISGDVRILELEAVTDVTRTSTVAGDVCLIKGRTNHTAAVTGHVVAIKLGQSEAAGGNWDGLAKVPVQASFCAKHTGAGAALPADAGYVTVIVTDADGAANPVVYKLALFNN